MIIEPADVDVPAVHDAKYIEKLAQDFKAQKDFAAAISKRLDGMKKELLVYAESYGEMDEKGSQRVTFDSCTLQRQRRVSRNLDGDAVESRTKRVFERSDGVCSDPAQG